MRLRCENSEEASDLTQQVFLQALRKLGSYRDRGVPFTAWLMRITRNVAIDASRRRRESLSWDLVPEVHLSHDDANPETAALDGDLLRRLRELIAALDAEKRDLLALRFSAGLSAREIGLVVGKSEAAVQKQVRRTLELLKENLDAE